MRSVGKNLLAFAAVAFLAAGCASGAAMTRASDLDMTVEDDRTAISVTNNNWADMTIYLLRNGTKQRLGTVTSQSTETFMLPVHLIMSSGDVQLAADPIGSSQAFTSGPIMIAPGQRAEWKLENSLPLSSFWIR